MKKVLKIVLTIDLLLFFWGSYSQSTFPKRGALIVGIAVTIMAFVILPLFLYTRYKDKKLSQYLFPKEPPKSSNASKKD